MSITFASSTGPSLVPTSSLPKSSTIHPGHEEYFIEKLLSQPADQPNDSRGKPSRQKFDKDKPQWDPIPITYTELFPKLVEIGHIESVHLAPLRPLFPRWYNAHAQCDYHAGNPGHSIKNCTAFKHKIRDLINDGKLKFEDLDRLAKVKDLSRTKMKMTRQEKETPKKANFRKATMPKEKVPIAKVRRNEVGTSSTTKGLKERSCEPNGEEEKKSALGFGSKPRTNTQ